MSVVGALELTLKQSQERELVELHELRTAT